MCQCHGTRPNGKKLVLYQELLAIGILPEEDELTGVASQTDELQTLVTAEVEAMSASPSVDPDVAQSSLGDPMMLALWIKELDLELSQQDYQTQFLKLRVFELETDREVKFRELELRAKDRKPTPMPRNSLGGFTMVPPQHVKALTQVQTPRVTTEGTLSVISIDFDVSRQIRLVPLFRENEIDKYFPVFEGIATTLHWPNSMWSLLLQCKLIGKAQEMCSTLSLEESMD